MSSIQDTLNAAVRDVPNFPKEGILFKDITPILGDPKLLDLAIDAMVAPYEGMHIDKVAGIDARGFIFGSLMAKKMNAGFIPVRKAGKLPWKTKSCAYTLEYGDAVVEIHEDAATSQESLIIVDDLLATGGTAGAAIKLINEIGAKLIGTSFFIELEFLNGSKNLGTDAPVHTLLKY